MKILVLTFLALILLFIQSSVLTPFGAWFPARPDLLLLLVIAWGVAFGYGQGVVALALCGFLMDLASALPMGGHVLALVPVLILLLLFERQLMASKIVSSLLLVFSATFLYYLSLAIVLQFSGRHVDWGGSLVQTVVPGALINVVVSPLFFWVTAALASWLGVSRGGSSAVPRPVTRAEL